MANFQVRLDMASQGKSVANVTNWQLPDAATATKQAFADSLRASFILNPLTRLSPTWSFNGVTLRQMDGGGVFSEIFGFTLGPLIGTSLSDELANQTAFLISTGASAPRPNRGRVYFSGQTEGSLVDGLFTVGVSNEFVALVEEWRDGIDADGFNAFLRIARPNFLLNNWTLDNPVETVVGRLAPASQRRRRVEA